MQVVRKSNAFNSWTPMLSFLCGPPTSLHSVNVTHNFLFVIWDELPSTVCVAVVTCICTFHVGSRLPAVTPRGLLVLRSETEISFFGSTSSVPALTSTLNRCVAPPLPSGICVYSTKLCGDFLWASSQQEYRGGRHTNATEKGVWMR